MTDVPVCPSCGSDDLAPFYEVDAVPVNSCLLLADAQAARTFACGELRLAVCACGFITNTAFRPTLTMYTSDYEETQGCSPRFHGYMTELAEDWTTRYGLNGKTVVEIGCGKGEFLEAMLRAGVRNGVGVDPSLDLARVDPQFSGRATWIRGMFPDDMPTLDVDAVICRHTLEHLQPVGEWIRTLSAALGSRRDTVILFEVPDVQRVLETGAFWDIYYEHCSYFSAGSLEALFSSSGFDVHRVRRTYDDQYLVVEASPGDDATSSIAYDSEIIRTAAATFSAAQAATTKRWRTQIARIADRRGRTVLWGASSKAVAFLAALGDEARKVAAAVDINPRKHNHYLAGTGHPVVSPKALVDLQPEFVIAMNPVYLDEISAELDSLGVDATLEAV